MDRKLNTMFTTKFLNIFTSIPPSEINQVLLRGKKFVEFNGQLLFEQEGKLAMTTIDNKNETYNDEDYRHLPEGAPIQLIDGKLIIMSSPIELHQRILGNLFALIHIFNKQYKLGRVYAAPLDVYLDVKNAFQPDILFISNERKDIIQDFIEGAPDFVVEITSPSTKKYDLKEKLEAYGRNNILEYWVIHPTKEELLIYLNKKGKMELHKTFSKKGKVKAKAIKGFSCKLAEIFEE